MIHKLLKWAFRRGEMHRLIMMSDYLQEFPVRTPEQREMQRQLRSHLQRQYRMLGEKENE